jgi:DNA-binding response OmpR family regulator
MGADRTQRKALVLDADRASASLLVSLLSNARQCSTFEAAHAPGALAMAAQADPDIIFVAHAPPEVDAPRFTRELRHSDMGARKAPVVMLAPEPTESLTLAARDAGVHEVLRKPFTMKDLLLRYDVLLSKERNWIEGISYVGPDRRRFNSAQFAGSRKRRADAEAISPENARIGQALRIMKSAIDAFEAEPRQALRALRAQADELQAAAVAIADYALAAAADTLKQYLESSPRLSQRQLAANLDGMLEAAGAPAEAEPKTKSLWMK